MNKISEHDFIHMILNVIRRIRQEIDSEMPTQTLQTLLHVALEPALPQRHLQDLLGISRAGASRNVHNLMQETDNRQPGPGLIMQNQHPESRRSMVLNLTPKAHRLVRSLWEKAQLFISQPTTEAG